MSKPPYSGEIAPHLILQQLLYGPLVAKAIQTAASLGLADEIGDQSKTPGELAEATGTHHRALFRLLRALSSLGIFREVGDQRFANSALSHCLRSNVPQSIRDFAMYFPHDGNMQAWSHFEQAMGNEESTYQEVHGCSIWDYVEKHPDVRSSFNRAMTALTAQVSPAIVRAIDFQKFGSLIDIGGGEGLLLGSILQAHPQMKGALFDLPGVCDHAKTLLEKHQVDQRCEIVEGNFFREIPKGYDAYVLKQVLHDWADSDALHILNNCRKAIPEHGRLLIIDAVTDQESGTNLGTMVDLHMLVAVGGRERSKADWTGLLSAAEFALERIIPLPGQLSIIQAVPVTESS
jgi:hypothetical protein